MVADTLIASIVSTDFLAVDFGPAGIEIGDGFRIISAKNTISGPQHAGLDSTE